LTGLLNVICNSEKRKGLLVLLSRSGPKTLDEIKQVLGVTTSGMLPQIRILEKEHLVERRGKEYGLTSLGNLVMTHYQPLEDTIRVLENQKIYWRDHDISAIPAEMRLRIHELKNLQIVESGVEDSFEPRQNLLENVTSSRRICSVSPVLYQHYPRLFSELAQNGREIAFVLTKKALLKIKEDHLPLLEEGLLHPNACIYMFDGDIRLAHVVTDSYFSLSLFLNNGIFDSTRDLVSRDPGSLGWGHDLFSAFMERSRRISSLSDISGR
jgi:predicted transcriptional regulator